jgi:glycosyltransferase involved in cell wall biosynthesis
MTPQATVVITTKNRKDELRTAVASCLRQSVPVETIVIDDGSTDGTSDLVRSEFPSVRLLRYEVSGGLIQRRNDGAANASTNFIFSIDDDAEFSTPDVVAQTLADFSHPRIGAVAIPFCDVKKGTTVQQRASDRARIELADRFIGTAHALRRDVFQHVGCYRAKLIHQGEEGDLTIRMLAAGYVVRLGNADIIRHYESPKRDLTRMTVFGRRNDILYAACNLPLSMAMIHIPATTLNGLRFGLANGYFLISLKGVMRGFFDMPGFLSDRRPVPAAVYKLSRRLRRNSGTPLTDIEHLLPPLQTPTHPTPPATPTPPAVVPS